jgi:hypothetical protein
MSGTKLVITGVITAVLVALLGWQLHRERLVQACLGSGGAWDGRACGPPSVRPILRRDLHRS